jgi:hypothetical protein
MIDVRLTGIHDGPASLVIKVAATRSNPASGREVGQSKSHGAMLALTGIAGL